MTLNIHPPQKIYVKNSPVHGLGVFASEKINKDEIFEICPILSLPMKFGEVSPLFIECGYWDPKNTIYGYEIGNENIIDYFQGTQHRINSEFSGLKNHRLISSVTYFKNCIILTKMTSQEIEENKRKYRFKEML